LFLIFLGHYFLNIFGQDFVDGKGALIILSVGRLLNVAFGSVGAIMIMTGHEREAAFGVGVSAVANVMLNATLIPKWGINGAALATTISLILWNVTLCTYVFRRLGINATILGAVRSRGS
jgi:O-antigen/teichoic acid export membrane protein